MSTAENINYRISKSNVDTIKFVTTLLSYIFLLMGSSIVIYFSFKRGNPVALQVLYCFALALNISQIIVSSINFIFRKRGYYNNKLTKIEAIVLIAWGVIVFSEFIAACAIFKVFRIDSFLISLVQCFVIFLMLFLNNKVAYFVNRKKTSGQKKIDLRNPENIRKRENKKSVFYVVICLCVFAIEICSLVFPMMPPTIDNIFAEDRLLNYTYMDEIDGRDAGYYVSDIYLGTNNSVVIPLTYNNKPVVGILEKAIYDLGDINSFQIGEYDDKGVLKSNVKYICKNAISLKNIKSLNIPESVEIIESKAIVAPKLEELNYYSKNAFKSSSFVSENLSVINMLNEEGAVNIDYDNITAKVNVPNKLYNEYREKYFENRDLFATKLDENKIIIDFETNCDTYLESKFLDLNNAKLNITALKNSGDETNSLIEDTSIYNSNNYECEGFISRPGYAFRGWYRDSKFTNGMECVFSSNEDVYFSENTTLYAKWEKIREVQLDWNQFYPLNESVTKYKFIDSKDINQIIKLPAFVTSDGNIKREGYTGLKWMYDDKVIESTADLFDIGGDVIKLKAEWILQKPTIKYETIVNSNHYDGNNLTFTFDESQLINYVASFEHVSDLVKITCNLYKVNDENDRTLITSLTTSNKDTFNYVLRNFADSGVYCCEIIARSDTGETATVTNNYNILINKKDLDISALGDVAGIVTNYNGMQHPMEYEYAIPTYMAVNTVYDLGEGYNSSTAPINANNGIYGVRFEFQNISKEKDNYNLAYKYSSIKIMPKPVVADWTQDSLDWSNDFEIQYDGTAKLLIPKVDGICAKDKVNFILREANDKLIDSATYQSNIIGVDNPNYTLDESNIIKTHMWKIAPRKVTTHWDSSSEVYQGNDISFNLKFTGIVDRDKNNIKKENFSINTNCAVQYDNANDTLAFTSKDAKDYTANVSAFDNPNYIFEPVTQALTINKAPLTLAWDNLTTTYNGEQQSANLSISGFLCGDETLFDDQLLHQKLNISSAIPYGISSQGNGILGINFNAKDSNSYNIAINSIDNDNYSLIKNEETFVVSPRILTGRWDKYTYTYDGTDKRLSYIIENLNPNDCAIMEVSDFLVTVPTQLDYVTLKQDPVVDSSIILSFYSKNAGTYNVSVDEFNTSRFNGNYIINKPTSNEFTINPKLLDVTWGESLFNYDSNEKVVKAIINNACENDEINLEYTNNKKTIPGSYRASITSLNPNYTTDFTTDFAWEILHKPLDVSIVDETTSYNGGKQNYKLVYSGFIPSDLELLDTASFKYAITNGTYLGSNRVGNTIEATFNGVDAGVYDITLNEQHIGPYIVNSELMHNSYKINQCEVVCEWNYSTDNIYSGNNITVTPTVKNACFRDGVYDTVTVFPISNSFVNVGSYVATLDEYTSNPNYHCTPKQCSFNWEVKPLPIELQWNEIANITFNGLHNYVVPTSNIVAGDNVSLIYDFYNYDTSKLVNDTVNVGKYIMKLKELSGIDAYNYCMPVEELSTIYDIQPHELLVDTIKYKPTYNGQDQDLVKFVISDFPTYSEANAFAIGNNYEANGNLAQSYRSESTGNSATFIYYAKNVDSYDISINKSLNKNYTFNILAEGHTTICPRVITVQWPQADYVYDGEEHYFNPEITNLVNNDIVNIGYNCSGLSYIGNNINSPVSTDAGVYKVEIVSVDNPNYSINYNGSSVNPASKEFRIARRKVDCSLIEFVGYVYNGKYQGVSFNINNIVAKDDNLFKDNPLNIATNVDRIDYSYDKNCHQGILSLLGVNVGKYDYNIQSLNSSFTNSNYEIISSINNYFNINQKVIDVKWPENSYVYDAIYKDVVPVINSTLCFNFINNSYDKANLTCLNSRGINVGTYTTEITNIDNPNYAINNGSFTWSITPKKLYAQAVSNNKVYDGEYGYSNIIISGFEKTAYKDDTLGLNDKTIITNTGSMDVDSFKVDQNKLTLTVKALDAGAYYYYINGVQNNNYMIDHITFQFEIGKKELAINWGQTEFDYDGQLKEVKPSFIGQCVRVDTGLDVINPIMENNVATNANTYRTKVSGISGQYAKNYKLPIDTTKQFIINKIKLSTEVQGDQNITYDANLHDVNIILKGFKGDDASKITSGNLIGSFDTVINNINSMNNDVVVNFKVKDVGTYNYTINGLNRNYELISPATISVTVGERQISANCTKDNSFTYNGEQHEICIDILNVCENDLPQMSSYLIVDTDISNYSISTETNKVVIKVNSTYVGKHTINITNINGNYNLVPLTLTFEIKPKNITAKWIMPNIEYDGQMKDVKLELKGVCSVINSYDINTNQRITKIENLGDTATIHFSNYSNVGVYSYVFNGMNNKNYSCTEINSTLYIKKRVLNVKYDQKNNYTYDGTPQKREIVINNFIEKDVSAAKSNLYNYESNGDLVEVSSSANSLIIRYYETDAKNNIFFRFNGTLGENYNDVVINDSFNINKKELTLNQSELANGRVVFNGLVSNDTIAKENYEIKYFTDKECQNEVTSISSPNTYFYQIKLINVKNYIIKNQGSFIVEDQHAQN